jgi:predicted AAA+ superfamily ATPase
MENVVFIELLRRKLYLKSDWELYYWKDYAGREIDFIIKNRDSIKQLIQVTYASDKNEINQRELESFRVGASELKCDNMLVITWDHEGTALVNDKTVVFIPLWKWLLDRSD